MPGYLFCTISSCIGVARLKSIYRVFHCFYIYLLEMSLHLVDSVDRDADLRGRSSRWDYHIVNIL